MAKIHAAAAMALQRGRHGPAKRRGCGSRGGSAVGVCERRELDRGHLRKPVGHAVEQTRDLAVSAAGPKLPAVLAAAERGAWRRERLLELRKVKHHRRAQRGRGRVLVVGVGVLLLLLLLLVVLLRVVLLQVHRRRRQRRVVIRLRRRRRRHAADPVIETAKHVVEVLACKVINASVPRQRRGCSCGRRAVAELRRADRRWRWHELGSSGRRRRLLLRERALLSSRGRRGAAELGQAILIVDAARSRWDCLVVSYIEVRLGRGRDLGAERSGDGLVSENALERRGARGAGVREAA
jgi:hypothetical protein